MSSLCDYKRMLRSLDAGLSKTFYSLAQARRFVRDSFFQDVEEERSCQEDDAMTVQQVDMQNRHAMACRVRPAIQFPPMERTAKLFVDLWSRYGFAASCASPNVSLQDLAKDADIIWTDIESTQQHQVLRELMQGNEALKLPAMFVVHSDFQDLSVLAPTLSHAQNVVLIKRPVVMHNVIEMLQNSVMTRTRKTSPSPPPGLPITTLRI